jgi:hypothetical protein
MRAESAQAIWSRLDGIKQPLMKRCENYAGLTISKVCLPLGFQPESTDQTHDFQSIGAQCVNHVTNKLMLAMFAPSRPFFRVAPDKSMKAQLKSAGFTETALADALSQMEREAVAELDALGQRPKLYQVMRHLVVTGNVLLCIGEEALRVMGLRYYCVKRTAEGKLHTLAIRENVCYDELSQEVKDATAGRYHDEDDVEWYKIIQLQPNGMYEMTQWIDANQLPKKFNGRWAADDLPYLALTWDLADESDYGTGLVEEYAGDFEALSLLSEAVVDGGVLASEMRWMVNPAGMTSADDLNKSKNGDALPGAKDDVSAISGGNAQAVQSTLSIIAMYEKRVATGFLLNSAVTRDAERVTAEEIRMTAQELETSFGGVYSMLAPSIQKPLANWLLKSSGASLAGTQLKVVVITGLDALSRNGDLDNLRQCIADMAGTNNLPQVAQARLKFDAMASFIGQGRGINFGQFFMNDQEFAQVQQQQAQQRVAEQSAGAAGEAQAQAQAQPSDQGTQ